MTEQLAGGRFLAITSIIRLNQIEVAHDRFIGEDEQDMVSLDNARRFRETIRARYPQGAITWAFSYGALTSGLEQFEQLRAYARDCARMYGDEKTLSTLIQRPVSFESGLNWFQPNKAFESGFTFPL